MSEEKRDTVGKISLELSQKAPETRDPIEQMREQLTDYEKNIVDCVMRCRQEFEGDFYVVVATKKERLMQNVLRNYFWGRLTCPTPQYDEAVYKYDRNAEEVQFLWVVPSKDTCEVMKAHAMEVIAEERELLDFVLKFYDGTLLRVAKKLNGERDDSPLLVA